MYSSTVLKILIEKVFFCIYIYIYIGKLELNVRIQKCTNGGKNTRPPV